METIDFFGRIAVFRQVNRAKVVLLVAVIVLSVIAVVLGLIVGRVSALPFLVVLVVAAVALRKEAASTEMRRVPMSLAVSDGVLRLECQHSRLFDGRYVDQFYVCSLEDIDFAGFEGDAFKLRAKTLESFASENGAVIDHRTNDYSEITVSPDTSERGSIDSFVRSWGRVGQSDEFEAWRGGIDCDLRARTI